MYVYVQSLSCVQLFEPARRLSPCDFSQQEYWGGLPFPPPEDLPNPGIEPMFPASPALQVDSLPLSLGGSPKPYIHMYPFPPKLPSHPGCRLTLSSCPWAHSRTTLVIHVKQSGVCMSIPNSSTIPSPHPFPWQPLKSWLLTPKPEEFLYRFLKAFACMDILLST